mgnify:CR=1 FL=1
MQPPLVSAGVIGCFIDNIQRQTNLPDEWYVETNFFANQLRRQFFHAIVLYKMLNRLAAKGYTADSEIITYCHVGLGRGSFQYLALQLAGHDKVKLYMGSWSEYGNSSEPVATQ